MNKEKIFSGAFSDMVFALTYATIPLLAGIAGNRASLYPLVHLRMGIANLFIYPLACAVMIHVVSSDIRRQEGIRFLRGILWKWYSWPAGIIFWVCLLFHSVWMTMSFGWGEMVYGTNIYSFAATGDYVLMIAGGIFFFVFSVFITASLLGIDFKKIKSAGYEWFSGKDENTVMAVFRYTMLLILGPVFLLIILSFVIIIPFYLYCIIWWHLFNKTSDINKKNPLPFNNIPVPELLNAILLYLYALIMAFFFNAGVSHMVEISRGPGSYMPAWSAALFAMGLFYIPYRTFFSLGSGRSKLSWFTFFTGIIIIFAETVNRFRL